MNGYCSKCCKTLGNEKLMTFTLHIESSEERNIETSLFGFNRFIFSKHPAICGGDKTNDITLSCGDENGYVLCDECATKFTRMIGDFISNTVE